MYHPKRIIGVVNIIALQSLLSAWYPPPTHTHTLHRLKSTLLSSAPLPFLRHFVQSVFIHVKVALVEGSLLADRLCEGGPLRHTQLERMELVWRMFAGLEATGMLNDASLCLQAVVMCYGLLAPLIQHSITTKPLVQVCLSAPLLLTPSPPSPLPSL